jgi:hypothetical protein
MNMVLSLLLPDITVEGWYGHITGAYAIWIGSRLGTLVLHSVT